MGVSFDVVSIGCLGCNRFWNETQPVRTAHATTTLVRDGDQAILVDPSLPAEVLVHRLGERTGLSADQVDCVFLTSFLPVHRRALRLFDKADWLVSEAEIDACREHLAQMLVSEEQAGSEQTALVRDELAMLERCKPAPDRLTNQVHLFPTPGVTMGSSSLLLVPATATIAIVGDAIVNRDYLDNGRVYERCQDVDKATQSFVEIVEIADQIVCGHDNAIVCQTRGL
jgi:glyoxylase-like metal-dependent hydrolase (beta-lactamase superfamily II)